MTGPSCATCRYRNPVGDTLPEDGFCYRFPPTVLALWMPMHDQTVLEAHRPFVTGKEWCGEWRATEAVILEAAAAGAQALHPPPGDGPRGAPPEGER